MTIESIKLTTVATIPNTVQQWFSTFFGPCTTLTNIYLIDYFAMLTPHEQLVKTILYIGSLKRLQV